MKHVLILLFLSFFLEGCLKDDPTYDFNTRIRGNWEWVSSSGGYENQEITSEMTQHTQSLKISSHSIEQYVNGDITSIHNYLLVVDESIHNGTIVEEGRTYVSKRMLFRFEDGTTQAFLRKSDTLILLDECYNCFTHKYIPK